MASKQSGTKRLTDKQIRAIVAAIVAIACFIAYTISQRAEKEEIAAVEGIFTLHVIDVGNADSLLLEQGETKVLIDAGERGDSKTVLRYLADRGIRTLDLVIATHPHTDHMGGMADVLKNIEVKRFIQSYMPESATPTSDAYFDMLEMLDKKNIPVEEAKPGTKIQIGEAVMEILAPLSPDEEPNNMSVVTRVTFGKRRFLLMGDAEKTVEEQLLRSGAALKADVIKLGHHGSRSSSSEAFIRKVDPTFAIMTCGAGNRYGHPHRETVALMEKLKIPAFRCDVEGCMQFTTDGDYLRVVTQNGTEEAA